MQVHDSRLIITAFSPAAACILRAASFSAAPLRRRLRRLASCPRAREMAAHHHLDLLLAALLYGCAFSGALLAATSLALLAFLAGALLAALALAASDARRAAGTAARVAGEAAAVLRLARALAVYAVVKAAVRVALAARPKVGALASRGRRLGTAGDRLRYGAASAAGFTAV